jgi:hypothetical protein
MAAAIDEFPLGIQSTNLALEISEQGVYSKVLEWVGWLYWDISNIFVAAPTHRWLFKVIYIVIYLIYIILK